MTETQSTTAHNWNTSRVITIEVVLNKLKNLNEHKALLLLLNPNIYTLNFLLLPSIDFLS